jgi:hypothetical protein
MLTPEKEERAAKGGLCGEEGRGEERGKTAANEGERDGEPPVLLPEPDHGRRKHATEQGRNEQHPHWCMRESGNALFREAWHACLALELLIICAGLQPGQLGSLTYVCPWAAVSLTQPEPSRLLCAASAMFRPSFAMAASRGDSPESR